ncbi:MAG: hypothetical protein IKR48_12150 [Kiritimatiellae bacterium]|nr:hypothetical protein [Kiritimatiellia bacterium]
MNPDATVRRGNRLGFAIFRFILSIAGARGAYLLLLPVTGWYALTDRAARQGALPYLARRFPAHSKLRLFFDVWRLFYHQGKVLIDRGLVMAYPDRYQVRVKCDDAALLGTGTKGGVVILSHAGAWQATLPFLSRQCTDRRFDLIMRPEENPAADAAFHLAQSEERIRIIPPDQFIDHAAELVERVEGGGFVMTMGDRLYGAAAKSIQFFGSPARFPSAPYRLARMLECPLYVLFAVKAGTREFDIEIREIPPNPQSYADALQRFLEAYPYEGYLFRDCWQAE